MKFSCSYINVSVQNQARYRTALRPDVLNLDLTPDNNILYLRFLGFY
jgi:hypothetical protein